MTRSYLAWFMILFGIIFFLILFPESFCMFWFFFLIFFPDFWPNFYDAISFILAMTYLFVTQLIRVWHFSFIYAMSRDLQQCLDWCDRVEVPLSPTLPLHLVSLLKSLLVRASLSLAHVLSQPLLPLRRGADAARLIGDRGGNLVLVNRGGQMKEASKINVQASYLMLQGWYLILSCRLHISFCRLYMSLCILHMSLCRLHTSSCRVHTSCCISRLAWFRVSDCLSILRLFVNFVANSRAFQVDPSTCRTNGHRSPPFFFPLKIFFSTFFVFLFF